MRPLAALIAELEGLRNQAARASAESKAPELRAGSFWFGQGAALCLERLYAMPQLTDAQAERRRLCRDFGLIDTPENGTTYRELCAFVTVNAARFAPKISQDRRTITAHTMNATGDHLFVTASVFGACEVSALYSDGLQITTRIGGDGSDENAASFAKAAAHAQAVDPIKAFLRASAGTDGDGSEAGRAEPFTFLFDHAAALDWGMTERGELIAHKVDASGNGPAYGLLATIARDGEAVVRASPEPPATGSALSSATIAASPTVTAARQGCYHALRAFAYARQETQAKA